MAYLGVLLVTILISFMVVRLGAFALQLTGVEPPVAVFQALSAFSGAGFTTTEAERVVRYPARRRIVEVLILLGNAGLVAVIATSVASFTKVQGYGWFLGRLAIVLVAIFVLYRLVMRSGIGSQLLLASRRPLYKLLIRELPVTEEIFGTGEGWGIYMVTVGHNALPHGRSVGSLDKELGIEVLAYERTGKFVVRPLPDDEVEFGDRLVVCGPSMSLAKLTEHQS